MSAHVDAYISATLYEKGGRLIERPNARVRYRGSHESLMETGLFTSETLTPTGKGKGKEPRRRYDVLGNRISLDWYYGSCAGQPKRMLRVTYRSLAPERLVELPGALAGLAVFGQQWPPCPDCGDFGIHHACPSRIATARSRPRLVVDNTHGLRLVVDNTCEVTP